MTRLVQVVPRPGIRLFGKIVKKQIDVSRKGKGTFYRSARKERNRAKWSHAAYKGWIKLERTAGEVVAVEVKSLSQSGDQWKLLHGFIGWIDRHFAGDIQAINIQYREQP